ncbi:hypothetical protein AC624_25105 [Bacillus sp. FJAT-27238]|nr:hypothetical protein AC624_25105 [Bacillus sp. FJAT-27238]
MVVGRKQEKTLRFLSHPLGDGLPDSMQKAKPRPKWFFQEVFQRWTLKSVFHFLHGVSVGVPKIFAVFSCFLYELFVSLGFKSLKRTKNVFSNPREEYFQT